MSAMNGDLRAAGRVSVRVIRARPTWRRRVADFLRFRILWRFRS